MTWFEIFPLYAWFALSRPCSLKLQIWMQCLAESSQEKKNADISADFYFFPSPVQTRWRPCGNPSGSTLCCGSGLAMAATHCSCAVFASPSCVRVMCVSWFSCLINWWTLSGRTGQYLARQSCHQESPGYAFPVALPVEADKRGTLLRVNSQYFTASYPHISKHREKIQFFFLLFLHFTKKQIQIPSYLSIIIACMQNLTKREDNKQQTTTLTKQKRKITNYIYVYEKITKPSINTTPVQGKRY